jgi:transglutaminase-like putative cysteine protease
MSRHLWCLAALILASTTVRGDEAYDVWTRPARYRFEYRLDAASLGNPKAKRLRIWLPYPAQTDDQKVISADVTAPWPHQVTTDAFGNQMVYLEGAAPLPGDIDMRFVVERRPSSGTPRSEVSQNGALDPGKYLRSNHLIPLDGMIQQVAVQESRGINDQNAKVRAFYDYVVRNMTYNKDGTGWGRGDAIWACTNKRGNCTDFHSLFIGMARSQDIPARFLIGFPIPAGSEHGTIPGYHCWAEYFDRERGWIPLDASEAKKSGWFDAYFGWLPSDRIQFTVGRDLTLQPPQDGPDLNYFIYPYVEADGAPVPDVKATFQFERLPLASSS